MTDALRNITAEIEERQEKLSSQIGRDAVRELIKKSRLYLTQVQPELISSLLAEDWHSVSKQAHQIKGASMLFGNTALSALVARLQIKPRPTESKEVLIEELEEIFTIISQTLESKGR